MAEVKRVLKRNGIWALFAAFVIVAAIMRHDEGVFFSDGPYGIGKPIAWVMFLGFLAYTIRCNHVDNFLRAMRRLAHERWLRQIGLYQWLPVLTHLTGGILRCGKARRAK